MIEGDDFIRKICFLLAAFLLMIPLLTVFFYNNAAAEIIRYRGIDVSVWQSEINFTQVKEAGIEIVYIRAANGFYEDEYFAANAVGAIDAGLYVGFYDSVTASSAAQAVEQADYFCNLIARYDYNCRPAVDYETFGDLSADEINKVALAFAERIQENLGILPLFYTDSSRAADLWAENLTEYPLWVAEYGVTEPSSIGNWPSWAGFQYSDQGQIPGISGDVDLDVFTDAVFLENAFTGLPFYDISTADWFWRDVVAVYEKKLMYGVTEQYFKPYSGSTRAMVLETLYRLAGCPTSSAKLPFRDVPSTTWYHDAICWAYENNITTGWTDTMFYPDSIASRQEVATFFYRYAQLKKENIETASPLDGFKDNDQIAPWAKTAMSWAVDRSLIRGESTDVLAPLGAASRAQLAAILVRFLALE